MNSARFLVLVRNNKQSYVLYLAAAREVDLLHHTFCEKQSLSSYVLQGQTEVTNSIALFVATAVARFAFFVLMITR